MPSNLPSAAVIGAAYPHADAETLARYEYAMRAVHRADVAFQAARERHDHVGQLRAGFAKLQLEMEASELLREIDIGPAN